MGFELIEDNHTRTVEHIKQLIINLVHRKNGSLKINLSQYLSDECRQDYSTLSKIFSEAQGCTIEKYFIAQRIERVKELLEYADKIGSTKALLDYSIKSDSKEFIVVTEAGILYEMRKASPDKVFIPALSEQSGCNECNFMRLNTLEKIYDCLKNETPEIVIEKELCEKAVKPIQRMLDKSAKLGL